jgi:Zn-dependent protease
MSGLREPVIILVVLIASVIIHENAHGWMALALGDPTAKLAGRLTLNPLKHLDPVGSVIMPAFLAFTAGTAFGYAKPVPINPRKLKGGDKGFAVVALAGPVSNVLLAFLTATILRRMSQPSLATDILVTAVGVNLFLAAFNLVPIPPLDGSRLLRVVLSQRGIQVLDRIEPYGFLILMLLLFILPQPFFRLVSLIRDSLVRLLPI